MVKIPKTVSLMESLSWQLNTDYRKAEKREKAGTQRVNSTAARLAKLGLLLTFLET